MKAESETMKAESGRMKEKDEERNREGSDIGVVVGKQLLRSGTSVGAHYREAIRARSDAEIISKLEVRLQELEETRFWLELLREAKIVAWSGLSLLDQEADEVTAILVTIVKNRKTSRQ